MSENNSMCLSMTIIEFTLVPVVSDVFSRYIDLLLQREIQFPDQVLK